MQHAGLSLHIMCAHTLTCTHVGAPSRPLAASLICSPICPPPPSPSSPLPFLVPLPCHSYDVASHCALNLIMPEQWDCGKKSFLSIFVVKIVNCELQFLAKSSNNSYVNTIKTNTSESKSPLSHHGKKSCRHLILVLDLALC